MDKDLAVVLGASGFIGSHLTRRLSRSGRWRVRAVDLIPPRQAEPGVEHVIADARQPLAPDLAKGARAIFNLAAIHRTPGHPDPAYYDTNVGGALRGIELAEACGVETLVFTSSIAVYGPCEEPVSEATPLRPVTAYGRSKRLAEAAHRRWLERGPGRRLVIVRPGVVFGPGERGNYTQLARAVRGGYFAFPGRRDTVKSGGHVTELLRSLEFALARPEPDILYNFAYPEAATTAQIVARLAALSGRRSSPPTLPLPALLGAARLFEAADRLGLRNAVHRERVMKMVRSNRIVPGWLLASGYAFATDTASALAQWAEESEGRFV